MRKPWGNFERYKLGNERLKRLLGRHARVDPKCPPFIRIMGSVSLQSKAIDLKNQTRKKSRLMMQQ